MHYKEWLTRADKGRRNFPLYAFADLRHCVNIVSVVNGLGVVLFFPDRNCIVHATPDKLDFLKAHACHELLRHTFKPLVLAVKCHSVGHVSLWDASIFNVRLGIWHGPYHCGGCHARLSHGSSMHPTLIFDGCRL